MLIAVLVTITFFLGRNPVKTIDESDTIASCGEAFGANIRSRMNEDDVIITVGGGSMEEFGFAFYVSENMHLMVEGEFLRSLLLCSVQRYPDGTVLVMKGDNKIELAIGKDTATVNRKTEVDLGDSVYLDEETDSLILPIDHIAEYLSYQVEYHVEEKWVDLAILPGEVALPERYDMRDYGRVSPVRDQGRYGTCWAFASLGALETTVRPMENSIFSVDHMSMCNSYALDINSGGEHTMSIAYLAAWQGPVYEKDDPYGDGMSDPNLSAEKHLEEALIINGRDDETIKSAIFRYGAIETSIYSAMEYADSYSMYYSSEYAAYYYDGDETPNHDVVVVGWDDNYSRENFTIRPEGDGAYICKNSWGEEFGDDGYFYVSYYDTKICNKSVVYTRVGDKDNYDNIYQTDKLGWVGQLGFSKEDAYFSNVYKAGVDEELAAVSFYATDKNTEFEVYVVRDFQDVDSFKEREFVVSGSMKHAGYYTVDFPEAIPLEDYERYAVIVKIHTPGAVHPIAIEYNADERSASFDISDGEGYISLYGEMWHRAETSEKCNVCLKAFTNRTGTTKKKTKNAANETINTATDTDAER